MNENVEDDDALLRRVADKPDLWKRTDDGTVRPTSVAFKPHNADGGVSVELRRLLPDPTAPLSVLDSFSTHGLAELFAAAVRSVGLDVVSDPLPESAAHAGSLVPPVEQASH